MKRWSGTVATASTWVGIAIPVAAFFFMCNGVRIPTGIYLALLGLGILCGAIAVASLLVWDESPWYVAIIGLAMNLFLLGMWYSGYIENKAFR
jgi:hypothetical protein